MLEEWKFIKGFNEKYAISNTGKVKSFKNSKPIIMKPSIVGRGYESVGLSKQGIRYGFTVHKLVAECFLGKPIKGLVVNHKDSNKLNNNIENLEYVTHRENVKHSFDTGAVVRGFGNNAHRRKLDDMQVLTVKTLLKIRTNKEIARHYNVNPTCICDIKRNKSWSWMGVDFNDNWKR